MTATGNWSRRVGLSILAALIITAFYFGFRPAPAIIETATVERGPLQVTIEEEGRTRVIDRYLLSAPVSGYLQRIDLTVGNDVKKGQVVASLKPLPATALDPRARAEARARVAAAQASERASRENARAAKADADVAAATFKRTLSLYEAKNVALERLEEARARADMTRAALRSAEFAVEVARHQVEAAQTALRYSGVEAADADQIDIESPLDASVLKIHRKSAGVVNAGEALLEVGDPRSLEVEIDVLSRDAVQIAPGTPVLFEQWGGADVLAGEVRVVEPVGFTKISALGVEEQRVLVIADITAPHGQWRRLGDGYRVEARFVLWQGQDVLRIPNNALFRQDGKWSVFVFEDNVARLRQVESGHRGNFMLEVLSGLTEGETIIVHPDAALGDGAAVRVR